MFANILMTAGLAFLLLGALGAWRGWITQSWPTTEATLLSIQDNLRNLARALFGLTDRALPMGWPASAAVLTLLAMGCLLILRRRVRAVEIVS